MISKARIKQIHSLELRKYRREYGLFVAEGPKLVQELLVKMTPVYIAALPQWVQQHVALCNKVPHDILSEEELHKVSLLKTPQDVIALFPLPQWELDRNKMEQSLCLALDDVQDPGNLGTICRIADWFGIEDILCNSGTADIYSPKAVQATMGALARVRFHYVDLSSFLSECNTPIYGTFLDGENMYAKSLQNKGIIVMGNEGKGISKEVASYVNERLYIPNYPEGRHCTESLNVAVATSIICAEFRRREQ